MRVVDTNEVAPGPGWSAGDGTEPQTSPPPRSRTSPALWAISAVLVALVVSQGPGLIAAETRTDLALDPGGFLGQLFEMWDPSADMGRLRNQGVGYLFPMGIFHLVGDWLGVPAWLVIRLWVATVLVIALWGFARLADELEIGRPTTRVLAATAYTLSPLFIARVGVTSWFALGAALAPWCLLPLMRASRGGAILRRAAVSGLAVAAVGGVNAAVVAGMLVLPAVWLLTRRRGARRTRLTLLWVGAVVAATSWWVVPLVLQGRLGYDFLPVTEQSFTTAAYVSPFEVVRGLADWLAYARFQRTPLPGGWELATSGPLIVATGLVAATGVLGLARRDLPHRRFLVLAFLTGVVVMSAGYGGDLGNPFSEAVRGMLDGPLGPLRSLYKFQPVVLLPLCLGLAHGLSVLLTTVAGRVRGRAEGLWVGGTVAVATVVVLAAGYPLIGGNLLNEKPFEAVPDWWVEAAAAVDDAPGRVLLVPGLPKADHTWGYTAEEPLGWLSDRPWATRSIVPLGSTGATTVLDTIEAAITRGGDPALPAYLSRNGFSTVMVRNDAEWERYGAPSPQTVTLAMGASGLERTRSFGPTSPSDTDPLGATLRVGQIEIFEVPGFEDGDMVTTYPVATAAAVSGDASAPLPIARYEGLDRALILAQDADEVALPDEWVVTDTNRRRYTSFGLNRANGSHVLTPTDDGPNGLPLERGSLPDARVEHQTVAARSGLADLDASSHGSLLLPIPETSPGRVIDGDPATAWITGAQQGSDGQWIRLSLDEPLETDRLGVELLDDGPWRTRIDAIDVVTDTGRATTPVLAGEGLQHLAVPPGPTSQITLVLASDRTRPGATAPAGIREIVVPGLVVDERLRTPSEFVEEFASSDLPLPTFVLERSQVSPWSLLRNDEDRSLRRVLEIPHEGSMALEAWVSPEPGPALMATVGADPTLQVAASATLGDLPRFAPRNLVDDDSGTVWIGARPPSADDAQYSMPAVAPEGVVPWQAEDRTPTITMTWTQPRLIPELRFRFVPGYSSPSSILVEGAGESRAAEIDADGIARFSPLMTTSIQVSFTQVSSYVVQGPLGLQVRPVALSALTSPWITDLLPGPLAKAAPIEVTCEEGPTVEVGGETRRLSVTASAEDVVALRDVKATVCDDAPIAVAPGEVIVDSPNDDAPFVVASLALSDAAEAAAIGAAAGGAGAETAGARDPEIAEWGDGRRRVEIDAGDAVFLNVKENRNAGWTATLAGERLEPVTLDGWQQGFVVPAGPGGTIELVYAPQRLHSVGLVVGGLLVVLLLAAAAVPGRPSRLDGLDEGTWPVTVDRVVLGVGAVTFAGIASLLVIPMAYLRRHRWRWSAAVGAMSCATAALYVGLTQSPMRDSVTGSRGWVATVLSIVAVLAVGVNLGHVADPPDPDADADADAEE